MKIYRLKDRIEIKINDVKVEISPLTFAQKSEIQSLIIEAAKDNIASGIEGTKLAIKYALKSISGIEDVDGNPYQLGLDSSGNISEDCLEDLLNSEMSNELTLTCLSLLQGIPSDIIDPNTGKKLQGVSIIKKHPAKRKKN